MDDETTEYQSHEYADLFPMMNETDFSALVRNMQTDGYNEDQPIILLNGKILDGRNRYKASRQAGVKPVFSQYTGINPLKYVLDRNLTRRHLNESQRAVIAERLANMVHGGDRRSESFQSANWQIESGPQLSITQAAELMSTSPRSAHRVRSVREHAPELIDKIMSGEMTVTAATHIVKEQEREQRREDNRKKIERVSEPEKVVQVIDAKYATIVIDPPWDWGDEGDQDQFGRARPDYSTMSISQLEQLNVQGLADVDCHLYLWITNRSLPKGFRLLECWGFRYITTLTWVKPSFGMGNYFRGQTEHVLFGVKGSQLLKRKDVGTVFHANRGPGGHSSKPVEFLELVESCSPGPYLEMFSRSHRKGWVTWGENS